MLYLSPGAGLTKIQKNSSKHNNNAQRKLNGVILYLMLVIQNNGLTINQINLLSKINTLKLKTEQKKLR